MRGAAPIMTKLKSNNPYIPSGIKMRSHPVQLSCMINSVFIMCYWLIDWFSAKHGCAWRWNREKCSSMEMTVIHECQCTQSFLIHYLVTLNWCRQEHTDVWHIATCFLILCFSLLQYCGLLQSRCLKESKKDIQTFGRFFFLFFSLSSLSIHTHYFLPTTIITQSGFLLNFSQHGQFQRCAGRTLR